MPTYQNFPCEFDSLGAVSLPTVPGAGATAGAEAQPTSSGKPGNRANAALVASTPRVGMTTDEVKALWGEPADMTKEEFVKGDIETWTYADSRSIQFDRKGRVTKIKW